MKPRTVILTLELQDCDVPLADLRLTDHADLWTPDGHDRSMPPNPRWRSVGHVRVAQATATVAQPSTTRGGKGRRR